MSTLYVEQWPGSGSDSWPAGWSSATPSNFDWAPGVGTILTAAGSRQANRALAHSAARVAFAVSLSALPSSGNADLAPILRGDAAMENQYRPWLRITSAGAIHTFLQRVVATSASTVAAGADTGLPAYAPGEWLLVDAMVRGASLEMRVWRPGTARPAQPTRVATDASLASGTHFGMIAGTAAGTPTWSIRAPLRVSRPGSRTIDARLLPRISLVAR